MGQMIEGRWITDAMSARGADGAFVRPPTTFRGAIEPGGRFAPERGRYHLYVSLACPWAHRTLIMRRLKGLDDFVSLSVTNWLMGEDGWTFEPGEGVVPDSIAGARLLSEVYLRADPAYTGRVTVPVLWDRHSATIVNNESAEILRILTRAFDAIGAAPGDYYPDRLRTEIDAVNHRIYDTLNNGVYRAGFATAQHAYEAAVAPLFATLDWLETRLSRQTYLCGDVLTEADLRLFTTLVRFDAVYHGHFKCNIRRLIDYPRLWNYARRVYQLPGVAETVDFGHIKRHYYMSHPWVNPTRIVPVGPEMDWSLPADRR